MSSMHTLINAKDCTRADWVRVIRLPCTYESNSGRVQRKNYVLPCVWTWQYNTAPCRSFTKDSKYSGLTTETPRIWRQTSGEYRIHFFIKEICLETTKTLGTPTKLVLRFFTLNFIWKEGPTRAEGYYFLASILSDVYWAAQSVMTVK